MEIQSYTALVRFARSLPGRFCIHGTSDEECLVAGSEYDKPLGVFRLYGEWSADLEKRLYKFDEELVYGWQEYLQDKPPSCTWQEWIEQHYPRYCVRYRSKPGGRLKTFYAQARSERGALGQLGLTYHRKGIARVPARHRTLQRKGNKLESSYWIQWPGTGRKVHSWEIQEVDQLPRHTKNLRTIF